MSRTNLPLPFGDLADSIDVRIDARDRDARARAVDPRYNVALQASAGTGKTRVLVDRYVNLLRAGVDPGNVLAITFTRKAAAEMRERIVASLRAAAERREIGAARWRELRDRTADIAISTIDAFCLSLLREFPLEADLDPGFAMADDTEVPRLIDESLDRALRICRATSRADEHVALVFAQLGDRRARAGLAALLGRRLVAPAVLARCVAGAPRELTVASAARDGAASLLRVFTSMRGGLERFLDTGPPEPGFLLLARQLRQLAHVLAGDSPLDPASVQAAFARVREHFLTQEGVPRNRLSYTKAQFVTAQDWQAHRDLVLAHAAGIRDAYRGYRRDLNVLVSRGVSRMFAIAEAEYRRTLDAHAVPDFSDVLLRTLKLLRQMEEFAQSRYRLEARYHHVLVDEFQDTSRAQWELISLLIQSWGDGAGLASTGPLPPSIFIVGDRKQSIYGFRDADVSILQEACGYLERLRPEGDVRRAISRSFRSVPALLAFVNALGGDLEKAPHRRDAFRYDEQDRFPLDGTAAEDAEPLGLIVSESPEGSAASTAGEIARLLDSGVLVRDRETGIRRPARPGDIAILFRTRESHREFEEALARRGIAAFVYKGLGFFDADEIKDVRSLLWYLADPTSDLRAAAWMRSRFARISDEGLRLLAPRLADALRLPDPPPAAAALDPHDAEALAAARAGVGRWGALVDRLPPAELLDLILTESAYAMELRGLRFFQARENLKKIRALIRRIQNRGYATLGRIAAHLDRLAVGDEANAAVDAIDAVNLMTVHAAKGLEFPVVFVVNLARGTGNRRDPIRVAADPAEDGVSVAVGDFRSDADEDDAAREREETKRLVYVALTRARDRLYLGSVLKDGRIQPGRGSLAEVLPPTLLAAFDEAASGAPQVAWQAASGERQTLRVCAAVNPALSPPADALAPTAAAAGDSDFPAPADAGVPRSTVAHLLAEDALERGGGAGDGSARLRGTLVHRLLQRVGVDPELGQAALREAVSRLVRPDERLDAAAEPSLFDDVLAIYLALCRHPLVRDAYRPGEALHEVPFAYAAGGRIVRGTIDCVVRIGADCVMVLEFKTGRARDEHEVQTDFYRLAVQAVFPGVRVEAHVVYAAELVA